MRVRKSTFNQLLGKRPQLLPEESQEFYSEKGSRVFLGFNLGEEFLKQKVNSVLYPRVQDSSPEIETKDYTFSSYNNISDAEIVTPIGFLKTKPSRPNFFTSLQKWEGYVISVDSDVFEASLTDLTGDGTVELVELEIKEVSPDDLDLLQPGAIFYWNIGYHDTSDGQRTRVSIIRFRRLPVWSKSELDNAKKRAEERYKSLGWE